jgi:hypothetical protein
MTVNIPTILTDWGGLAGLIAAKSMVLQRAIKIAVRVKPLGRFMLVHCQG